MSRTPLAYRMRPKSLDQIAGQKHMLGPGKLLRRAIEADRLGSVILYGPPGTGKTSIASVIANETEAEFIKVNAVAAGKKDMESAVAKAKKLLESGSQRTILFIDEIHRFNKAQQDYLLPYVESGLITLIGATTENPFFEINTALLSRSTVFELHPLSPDDVLEVLRRAVNTDDLFENIDVDPDALSFLSRACGGDLRGALNALELAALTTRKDEDGVIRITPEIASECIQKKLLPYDKDGDIHYDTISAFIKSMRGSDPQAALYWLARMLESGEDVKYIARRIMIHACEDVGMADPMALVTAVAASLAAERVGMPEADLILGQAAVYIACAPKSDSVCAGVKAARKYVRDTGPLPVPEHLRDSHCESAKFLGRGKGYVYPHSYPNHYVAQRYLPDGAQGAWFYEPGALGAERAVAERLNWLIREEARRQAARENGGTG